MRLKNMLVKHKNIYWKQITKLSNLIYNFPFIIFKMIN